MIDEIDYFSKRNKYKKKKDSGIDDEWDALKNDKSRQDLKTKAMKNKPETKQEEGDEEESQKK